MSWSEEDLYRKARLFVTRAFYEVPRSDALFPFWASLGLELLARAALAHVHPALLADPSQPDNLLYALGYEVKAPKSVPAKAVFSRCQRIIPGFTEIERDRCMALQYHRNEDLHSGGLPFESLPPEAWLTGFLKDCRVLLDFLDKSLEDFFGDEEASAAQRLIVEADEKVTVDVKRRIGQARKASEHLGDDVKVARRAEIGFRLRLSDTSTKESPCPACSSTAQLDGELIRLGEPRLRDEYILRERVYLAVRFGCSVCGLALGTHEELNAAGIGGQFAIEDTFEPLEFYREEFEEAYFEPDYGND